MINPWPLSYFGIAAILVALSTYVWRAKPDQPVNRWFAFFSLTVCSWVVGVGGLHTATNLEFWGRFTFSSACLIPATFFGFISWYPSPDNWTKGTLTRLLLVLGVGLSVLALATPLVVHSVTITQNTLHRNTGPLYPAFFVYFSTTWIVAAVVFRHKWLKSRGIARAQLQYLGVAIVVSLLGAILANLILPLVTGRSTYSWIGPYFAALLLALIGHAIIRHRLMDLRPVILRGLVYVVATSIVYLLLLTGLRVFFVSAMTHTLALPTHLLLAVVIVVVSASPPVTRLLSHLIEPYLYRGRVEYEAALREATHELSHLMDPRALANKFRAILTDTLVPEFFVMAARAAPDEPFEELASDGTHIPDTKDLTEGLSIALRDRVAPTVLLLQSPDDSLKYERLRRMGCEVILALGRRHQLRSVIVLGPRRSGDPYYTSDVAFIESLTELASVSLENAYLYQKQIELLEYSERLLESLDSAVVVIDVLGRLSSFNGAANRLFGLSSASVGATLNALPDEIAWALAFALIDARHQRQIEMTVDHPSVGLLPVMVSAAPLHAGQNVTGAFAVITDLSAVKALERNQRRIDRLSSMARFYAGLAHEIRTPLASISNFIAMLPDRFDDAEYRDTAMRLLPLEVNRIVQLADRLRLMAPSEGAKLRPVGLYGLLQDIISLHEPRASDAGISFIISSQPDLETVSGDPNQLTQLFLNLLKNAMEAMPHGGQVKIETHRVALSATKAGIRVRIIDEGVGLDITTSLKMFDPFFTTKPNGTGLGLSICREIAEFHDARLSVTPRTDGVRGSTAELIFPAASVEERGADSLEPSTVD